MTSGGGMPELGSKISLISKADIRYEGRLYTVDPNECTIALSSVRSFGTEDRDTQFQIAPQSQIYDYILFRGSDIKDIRVVNNGMPHPNDPAIMQVQLPNGQHLMPHFPMQTMNPPMGNYGNPFGAMGGLGGIGATPAAATGLAPGSFMLNKPKQPSELNDALPQEFNIMAINNSSTAAPPNAPSTSAAEHKDQDLLAGASRSTTPISLISRKSPSNDMAVQVNQQHNNNTGNNRDAGHKRQNHQQRGGNNNHGNNNGGNRNDGGVGGGGGGGGGYFQRDRRDSGRLDNNQHNNYNNQDNRNHYNNQRNQNQNQNSRGWTMNRGNNNNNNNMRNRGRGRLPNQGYRQMSSGNPSKNNRPKNTIKFEQDFDFEQANNKFEELRSQLAKLKVGDEPKAEQCSSPTSQINGEADKKDDSGNETGAGEHEPEDEEITVGYDKTKSFFDNISCEAAQDRSKNKKNDWRQERKLNNETFGIAYSRHGSYRGRGNYYNRNMNNYGGYNRGYRGGNYNTRNRNNNNNRMGQQNIQNNPQKNQNMQQPQSQQPTNKTSQETNNTPSQVPAVVAAQ